MVGREQHGNGGWLPSIMRAIRIQVVCGNCRSAGAGSIREIEGDHPEPAGLQDQVHRFQRAIGVPGFPNPEQAA